jgi:hypothetical protein
MLEKKAAKRFQSPAEVIAALAPWTGNSARVLAGLSRTKLAQSADVHSSLTDWSAHGSSLRLRDVPDSGSSSGLSFDSPEAAKATAAMSSSETARSRTPSPAPTPLSSTSITTTALHAPEPAQKQSRLVLFAAGGLGFAVLLAGILIGWLAFGR